MLFVLKTRYTTIRTFINMFRVVLKEEVESNPAFAEFRAHSRIDAESVGAYRYHFRKSSGPFCFKD